MELVRTSVLNYNKFTLPRIIDIAAIVVFVIFAFLNALFNHSADVLTNAVTYSSLLIVLAIFTKNIINNSPLVLLFISAAALCLGIVYGGIFGMAGIVVIWPLLMVINTRTPKHKSALLGIGASLSVFVIMCLYGLLTTQATQKIDYTETYYQWQIALNILFALYATVGIFLDYFNIKNKVPTSSYSNTEAKLTASEASSQTEFIAEMSHEIRTPLNAIMGFADTMQEEVFGPLDGKYKEYLGYIQQSGHHLLDLVGDILDMSKIDAGKYALNYGKHDFVKIIREVINMMQEHANRANVKINFFGHGNIDTYCDERSIRQIALNLLSNAIKFTPEGSEIDVSVYATDNKVWLEVKDSGRGMTDDELKHIGQPYISGSDIPKNIRSTGLGLSLVRKLVDFHDGIFTIKSKLGSGTTVIIELPRHANLEN